MDTPAATAPTATAPAATAPAATTPTDNISAAYDASYDTSYDASYAQYDMADIPVALPSNTDVLYSASAPPYPHTPECNIGEHFITTHMCIRCDQLIEIRVLLFMEKSYRMECPFCKYNFYFGAHETSSCIGPCTIL